jgi:hypothetical protein
LKLKKYKMAVILEETEGLGEEFGISNAELERILNKLGKKCCNKLVVERMITEGDRRFPGLLKGYCKYCLGYKPLGECKGKGYDDCSMQNIHEINELDFVRGGEVCF